MPEIVEGKHGLRYHLIGANDLISNAIRKQGEFEPELQRITCKLLQDQDGNVLDIGANLGTYALPVARLMPQVDVIAFEIQRKVFEQLSENVKLNGLRNVLPINLGLSDIEEERLVTVPVYEHEANIGGFSLDDEVKKHRAIAQTDGGQETIQLVTLDSFEFANVKLIKLDVEGLELKVLKGAFETLRANDYPALLFEAWTGSWFTQRRVELNDHLTSLGYKLKELGSNTLAQHGSSPFFRDFTVVAV